MQVIISNCNSMEESAYEIRSQGKDTQAQVIGISMAWRDVFIRDKSDLMFFFFWLDGSSWFGISCQRNSRPHFCLKAGLRPWACFLIQYSNTLLFFCKFIRTALSYYL